MQAISQLATLKGPLHCIACVATPAAPNIAIPRGSSQTQEAALMQKTRVSLLFCTALLAGCGSITGTPPSSSGNPPSSPPATALSISTNSLASGTAGGAYAASVSATGGTTPYVFSATGLPSGLSINSSTGSISGTPA